MKKYLEEKIAYYKREIPKLEISVAIEENKSKYFYDIEMEKLFKTKAYLFEAQRQLKLY